MTFIRAKEIPPRSGNWYDYEVPHVDGHVRQKVVKYLGKSGTHSYLSGGNAVLTSKPIETLSAPANTPLSDQSRIPKMKTPAKQIASAMGME